MAEVLSQDEIDALLKNVSSGKLKQEESDTDKETTYLYDFKHPNRVSKDQLRNLRTIHESFSRTLATYLTTLLRTIVDVNLLSIDQVTFLEFTMAMSNPGCIWIYKLENYEGKGVIEISPDLMLLTIERLFGGEGKQSGETRPLSMIDSNTVGHVRAESPVCSGGTGQRNRCCDVLGNQCAQYYVSDEHLFSLLCPRSHHSETGGR